MQPATGIFLPVWYFFHAGQKIFVVSDPVERYPVLFPAVRPLLRLSRARNRDAMPRLICLYRAQREKLGNSRQNEIGMIYQMRQFSQARISNHDLTVFQSRIMVEIGLFRAYLNEQNIIFQRVNDRLELLRSPKFIFVVVFIGRVHETNGFFRAENGQSFLVFRGIPVNKKGFTLRMDARFCFHKVIKTLNHVFMLFSVPEPPAFQSTSILKSKPEIHVCIGVKIMKIRIVQIHFRKEGIELDLMLRMLGAKVFQEGCKAPHVTRSKLKPYPNLHFFSSDSVRSSRRFRYA